MLVRPTSARVRLGNLLHPALLWQVARPLVGTHAQAQSPLRDWPLTETILLDSTVEPDFNVVTEIDRDELAEAIKSAGQIASCQNHC